MNGLRKLEGLFFMVDKQTEDMDAMITENDKPMKEKDWNQLKSWHEPMNDEIHCPICHARDVKTNGDGFYRCRGKCKNCFFMLRCTEVR